jgi:hypothetical protein
VVALRPGLIILAAGPAHSRLYSYRGRLSEASTFTETIEQFTGRKVLAFLSQAHVDPDITIEIFFVAAAIDGLGAVEVVDPA